MIPTLLIVFLSLIGLITIHELGHFFFAKKFGVKVEEFGMFLPPRLWGKKIGETIYSINLIPMGAFVRLYGEEGGGASDPRSFTSKPIWQRALIVAAGVISFWIIAIIIYAAVSMMGAVQSIDDSTDDPGARVQIAMISAKSPAAESGLQMGDIIKKITPKDDPGQAIETIKVQPAQDFILNHKGKELVFDIQRGKGELQVQLTPRQDPPEGQGPTGIVLIRTVEKAYPLPQAIENGFAATWNTTISVFDGWSQIISRLVKNEGMPPGAQMVGPIGIIDMMNKQAQAGASYYLQFIAMISVYLAVFNALPIPALDGGKLLFLLIEAIRKKPISEQLEQKLTTFFFLALMVLVVIVSVGDVKRLF